MITLLTGENNFEIDQMLRQIGTDFDGHAEKIDGSDLETRQLPDLLMGATLFADKRLVVIRELSENKSVWTDFVDWLPRISDDIHLVLVESKPDKRTKTYKELLKVADVHDLKSWGERDNALAEKWAIDQAKIAGFELDKKSAQTLINRVGLDQWQLYHSVQKLAVLQTITPEVISEVIDASPSENVFNLFESALRGETKQVSEMIRTLELTEDPYMLFGLLSGQAFQLAALAVGDKPQAAIARDIGAHPFALGKLSRYADRLEKPGAKKVIAAFAEADTAMKTSGGEPWLLIERALIKVASY